MVTGEAAYCLKPSQITFRQSMPTSHMAKAFIVFQRSIGILVFTGRIQSPCISNKASLAFAAYYAGLLPNASKATLFVKSFIDKRATTLT